MKARATTEVVTTARVVIEMTREQADDIRAFLRTPQDAPFWAARGEWPAVYALLDALDEAAEQ